MEAILAIAAFALILWASVMLSIYVILPLFSIVGIMGLAAGAGVALFMYIRAAMEYMKPYSLPRKVYSRTESDVYEYRGKKAEKKVKRRSYFFGPGLYSLKMTWISSWKYIFDVVKIYWGWREKINDKISRDWLRYMILAFYWIGLIAIGASMLVVGGIASFSIGLLHGAVVLVVMAVAYLIYSVLYGLDHFYLWKNAVSSICPRCKKRFIVPVYACSNCGAKHWRLIPSPYGIWTHTCTCGVRLPATFFNGRNKLESFCPYCEDERIASSSSRQFCISLVGASSSGKTTLLASYLHIVEDRLNKQGLSIEVPAECKKKMERLKRAYDDAEELTGTQISDYTDPYTLCISGKGMAFSRQFNIFDVAGETFESPDLGGIAYGQDFADSEALMILVDPLASPSLRKEVRDAGSSVNTASVFDPMLVVNNFANYLRQTSTKTGRLISRPTAVILTKTDLPVIKNIISSERLEEEVRMYPGDARTTRDRLSREFLKQYGFGSLIMALDANFSNVHFFSVSATGGAKPGETYFADPHLEEPFNWLINASGDTEFAQAMGILSLEEASNSNREVIL